MIRVPTPTEYAALPFAERRRVLDSMRSLLVMWANLEAPETRSTT